MLTVLWETLRCCIIPNRVVRVGLIMSRPSMFLFGLAILHANNPLKNVSSEFVFLCKKAAPLHFILASSQLMLSALIGNFTNKVSCFSHVVSHPIAKSHVNPWSVREHDTTWVRLLLPFVFEQSRLKAKNLGRGLFGLILAAPLIRKQQCAHTENQTMELYECTATFKSVKPERHCSNSVVWACERTRR